jgi:hypothetical protein
MPWRGVAKGEEQIVTILDGLNTSAAQMVAESQ